jgi:hypothetical protein
MGGNGMTNIRPALIESRRRIKYADVRAAFDRFETVHRGVWPVLAEIVLAAGDQTWLPDSTRRVYTAHRPTRVLYTQHQDGIVDFETFVTLNGPIAEMLARA